MLFTVSTSTCTTGGKRSPATGWLKAICRGTAEAVLKVAVCRLLDEISKAGCCVGQKIIGCGCGYALSPLTRRDLFLWVSSLPSLFCHVTVSSFAQRGVLSHRSSLRIRVPVWLSTQLFCKRVFWSLCPSLPLAISLQGCRSLLLGRASHL